MKPFNIIFSIGKVKELTKNIGIIQGKLNIIKQLYDSFDKNLVKSLEVGNKEEEHQLSIFENIIEIFRSINSNILKYTEITSNNWLFFKDFILSERKDSIKKSLLEKKITIELLNEIGVHLIKNKKVSSLLEKAKYINSIDLDSWASIIEGLKNNISFSKTINRVKLFHKNEIERLLRIELRRIPKNLDNKLVSEFKQEFRKYKTPFSVYIKNSKVILSKKKKTLINQIKNEVVEKDRQDVSEIRRDKSHFKSYDKLFNLSDEEFQRFKRKKARKKLEALSQKKKTEEPNKTDEVEAPIEEKIELSEEAIEESNGEDEETENVDPLDIIRQRKKNKQEEYDEYFDRIQKSTKRG